MTVHQNYLIMPQPTEALIQQGAIKPYTNNLLNSIDEAIEHFEDSEIQKLLNQYGFEVDSLIEDIKETKDCIYHIRDGQYTCIDALKAYIQNKRSLVLMPENIENYVDEYLIEIKKALNTPTFHGETSELLLEQWAITNAAKFQGDIQPLVKKLREMQEVCVKDIQESTNIDEERREININAIEKYFNIAISPLEIRRGY